MFTLGALSLWCNFIDLVKICFHEAEEYAGNRTSAGLHGRGSNGEWSISCTLKPESVIPISEITQISIAHWLLAPTVESEDWACILWFGSYWLRVLHEVSKNAWTNGNVYTNVSSKAGCNGRCSSRRDTSVTSRPPRRLVAQSAPALEAMRVATYIKHDESQGLVKPFRSRSTLPRRRATSAAPEYLPFYGRSVALREEHDVPEKTRRPAASSDTIRTCDNPGVSRSGIEPGSPWWEASRLTLYQNLVKSARMREARFFFFLDVRLYQSRKIVKLQGFAEGHASTGSFPRRHKELESRKCWWAESCECMRRRRYATRETLLPACAVRLLVSHRDDPGSIPGRVTPDSRTWESCPTAPPVGGFSRRSPAPPPPPGCSALISITRVGSRDLVVKSRPDPFTHSGFSVSNTYLTSPAMGGGLDTPLLAWVRVAHLGCDFAAGEELVRRALVPPAQEGLAAWVSSGTTHIPEGLGPLYGMTPSLAILVDCRSVSLPPPPSWFVWLPRPPGPALALSSLMAERSRAGMQGRGEREILEISRRPAVSSGTIPTCENPGASRPGIEPGSPSWEASGLTTRRRTRLCDHACRICCVGNRRATLNMYSFRPCLNSEGVLTLTLAHSGPLERIVTCGLFVPSNAVRAFCAYLHVSRCLKIRLARRKRAAVKWRRNIYALCTCKLLPDGACLILQTHTICCLAAERRFIAHFLQNDLVGRWYSGGCEFETNLIVVITSGGLYPRHQSWRLFVDSPRPNAVSCHGLGVEWSKAALIEVLRACEGGTSWIWSSAGMQKRGKREILEKNRRPVVSSGSIPLKSWNKDSVNDRNRALERESVCPLHRALQSKSKMLYSRSTVQYASFHSAPGFVQLLHAISCMHYASCNLPRASCILATHLS
ncbi:hypothetical protein PR048_023041 [Dryococelus australis]|uniref:Uncharacterized protein n=1 Tax=Dryococelus australis TaxID=614101 RepID=A0ABQ9GT20_9NEOP|nr:hypothetical protein PR048_023041 [Dryococelus australis]